MKKLLHVGYVTVALLSAGCGSKDDSSLNVQSDDDGLVSVKLRLDWYAEPAHGGFYQALLKGYYEEAGLDVEILQGGPGVVPLRAIASGQTDFTLGRVDDVIVGVDKGLPLQLAMAYMQRDPQAIMYHASNPIEDWEDLNGKTIMLNPGNIFVSVLRRQKNLSFNVIPLDYGIQRFLADEEFIQQCFVTSQPYFARQKGADVRVMLLSDENYSPERVVLTSKNFAEENPVLVESFVKASIHGWEDYMLGDPSETNDYLNRIHSGNSDDLNSFSHRTMLDYKVVFGEATSGESLGLIDPDKLTRTVSTLYELELIDNKVSNESLIDYSILPVQVSKFQD